MRSREKLSNEVIHNDPQKRKRKETKKQKKEDLSPAHSLVEHLLTHTHTRTWQYASIIYPAFICLY